MQKRYNVGDVVYIRPGTEYMSQSNGKSGVIESIKSLPDRDDHLVNDEYYYTVRWKDGHSNQYRNMDLISEKDYESSSSDHYPSKSEIIHQMKGRYGKISLSDRFISEFGCDGLVKTTNAMEWTYSNGSFQVSLFLGAPGDGGCRIYNYDKETGIEKWAVRANLPDKWQVFGDTNTSNGKKVSEWREKYTEYDSFSGQGYINETGYFKSSPDSKRAIITHDEFMKWVYDRKSKKSTSDLWVDPGSLKVWKIVANRDIYPQHLDCSGSMPFIAKETVLWIDDAEKQLDKIMNKSGNVYPFKNKWGANIPAEYFDFHPDNPYSEKTKPKFKVGDKVKVIDKTHGWGAVSYGEIGKVVEFAGKEEGSYKYYVNFRNHSHWTGYEKCFELVERSSSTGSGVVSIHDQSSITSDKYIMGVDPYDDQPKEHPYIKDIQAIDVQIVKPKKSKRLII